MADNEALQKSLNKLSIRPEPSKAAAEFKKKQTLAESWEDEELEDSRDGEHRRVSAQQFGHYPSAPPPTPISPSTSFHRETFANPYGYTADGATDLKTERGNSRPEKTDAVAKRMIAGALGVRTPKKTEEQKSYEKAIKEKEIKRRAQEKEAAARAEKEAELQKAAIWED